ncbi:MAG: hypothetical protein GY854_30140 [Deltaproteobacteria bacterium]|nr:hypothetical protein [Deltaproteobacteria bacterium]
MRKKTTISRREFVARGTMAGLAFGAGVACSKKPEQEKTKRVAAKTPAKPQLEINPESPIGEESKWAPFPVVEARGTPLEIGKAVGAMTKKRIHKGIELRREWFDDLKKFALADRANRIDNFVSAIEKFHPDVLAEMKGMAEGSGLPLDDILVLNMQAELGALKSANTSCEGSCEGCSSLHLVQEGRALLAHNEDGHDAYRHLMSILRLKPEGKPAFTSLAYPGLIPGSVPAINEAGILMTTNFIGVEKVRTGVPRYVLGRAAIGARSIGEAVQTVTSKEAAYSFHANFGSVKDKRLLAVDIMPGLHSVKPTEGIFLQTNHFVLSGTKAVPQPMNTPGGSSDSRYRVLQSAIGKLPPVEKVTKDDLIKLLSSHEAINQPYSPCRHPNEKSKGRTLATALFDVAAGTFTVYEGNPCEGRRRKIDLA